MDVLMVVGATLAGLLLASAVSILPGLHIYNVIGGFVLLFHGMAARGGSLPPLEFFVPFLSSMVVAWSMLNTIPSVLLGAPDESALFTVMPGQKYLMLGRGYEGAMITGIGSLAGLFVLVLVVGPLAPVLLPVVHYVLCKSHGPMEQSHVHWILWVIITFMLMSEWPKGGHVGKAGWAKFLDAWKSLGAGLLTFILAGMFGFLLLNRSPISVESAFQNIMPAFVGLFAVPWCLLNAISATNIPPQRIGETMEIDGEVILRSTACGGLGGGFAAFFPIVTGGVGGLLAGHATAQRDERVFIMSQGVSKLVYYTGAYMLFFVPLLNIRRGGGAWMIQSLFTARTYYDYLMILGVIALAGGLSFLLLSPMARFVLWLIERIDYRTVSWVALVIIVAIVLGVTGLAGLYVMLVGTGIGLLPVLFGSRRLNCLGVLLLPMACKMSGIDAPIARFLGLY